jgi:predicted AAA+ superfamily ATPase
MKYSRPTVADVLRGLRATTRVIQVVIGPRQVGKTTAAAEVEARLGWPTRSAAADDALPPGPAWIESHWQAARALPGRRVLLVLDEVQKVAGWSGVVKRLWDEELRRGGKVRVLLLGSSALLVQKGLAESLAGRFFLHRCMHWSWPECREAFGWTLPQWIFFGGYPGAAAWIRREEEWRRYIADSLVETAISRDVLQMQTITKPALLRHLFGLSAAFPAQILSYNKMLGQLHDAGNTTTLAGYLQLLGTAFLVSGLEAYSAGQGRKRGSSPKFVHWNNALVSALARRTFAQARADTAWWGRLVENAVGGWLLNGLSPAEWDVGYWRKGNAEVDYVVSRGRDAFAIEVKSGRFDKASGLDAFRRAYPRSRPLVVGSGGIPLEELFATAPTAFLGG